ncbi:hypothetical protein PQO03_11495 [Lentisphaera profundi]|uniref:Uncharacterized protein n=1 Tax=Lentisphaera profundi TaxID=1658616 RepID=A0ABY7VQ79_9BACT|nr:hypothetical protein [Lentisphaera profundi]WDE96333.1 hypothetical protein PQO03_11495 [Lentisphaera profundi]
MNEEKDIKFIENLIKNSSKQPLKRQRLIRNLTGVFILITFPLLGLFGLYKFKSKNEIEFNELFVNEFFIMGLVLALFIITPMIILILHLSENGDYDDLKKNDLIIKLYKNSNLEINQDQHNSEKQIDPKKRKLFFVILFGGFSVFFIGALSSQFLVDRNSDVSDYILAGSCLVTLIMITSTTTLIIDKKDDI